jgi:hypothetical protein
MLSQNNNARGYAAVLQYGLLIGMVFVGVGAAGTAHAADPGKCAQYAQSAVAQYQQSIANGCNFTGPRWQANYQAHYNWCLGATLAAVESETKARMTGLAVCAQTRMMKPGHPGIGKPTFPIPPGGFQTCETYAKAAVDQYVESMRLGCGFGGAQWTSDYQSHYNRCVTSSAPQRSAENKARQAQLARCQREKACAAYANSAVAQYNKNVAAKCGLSGPAWNSSFAYHYNWCVQGQNINRTASGTKARDTLLARCARKKPLAGTFAVKRVKPQFDATGIVQRLDVTIEATSSSPWNIGDYGHGAYGSMWAEVTSVNKIWSNGLVRDQKRQYMFAIRGIASGVQAFLTPHMGMQVGAGTHTLVIGMSPMPRIPLAGVQQYFGVPSGGPFQPGSLGCWHHFPNITVRVFIVTTANTATVRSGSTGDIMGAPLTKVGIPSQGGFGQGVVYQRCLP